MNIVIVDTLTLRAMGLQRIIAERYGLEAVITHDPTELEGVNDSTIFFVTPEAFVARHMYYVPRRERVALISEAGSSIIPWVNPRAGEAEIVAAVDDIMARIVTVTSSRSLTHREAQVLRLVAMGMTNKEISAHLGISFNTALTHRKNISAKLGIKSVPALGIYAMMNGLVTETDLRR